jgi:hypothetical protein
MGMSISLILAAAGAILIWAVNATVSGFNIHTAGVILLVVGVIGFIVSAVFWSSWGGFGGAAGTRRDGGNSTTVIER